LNFSRALSCPPGSMSKKFLVLLLLETVASQVSDSYVSQAAQPPEASPDSAWLKSILAAAQQSPEPQEISYKPSTQSTAAGQDDERPRAPAPPAPAPQSPSQPPAWANPLVLGAVEEAIPQEMSQTAGFGMEIFEGMVQTFLHKDQLTDEELSCLRGSVKGVAHLAYNSSQDLAHIFTSLLSPVAESMYASDHQPPSEEHIAKTGLKSAEQVAESGLDLMIAVPKISEQLGKIVDNLDKFMQDCHAGDSEKSFKIAAEHLRDLRYVAGHLQANSADVLKELKDASEDFNTGDYKGFGQQLGRVCRKVLLAGDGDKLLPEGAPSAQEISEVITGLLEGFIGPGAELDLRSKQEIPDVTSALLGEGEAPVGVHRLKLQLDLRKCVEKDQKYFESVLMSVYTVFAQFELGLPTSPASMVSTPGLIISELKALPKALKRCGLGHDPEKMFLDVLQAASASELQAKLVVDENAASHTKTVDDLAKDWQSHNWFELGEDMGDMMRKVIFSSLPQLYSVDDLGRLVRRPSGSETWAFVAPAALLLSVAVVLGQRARRAQSAQASPSEDSEMGLME